MSALRFLRVFVLLAVLATTTARAQTISTVVGGGTVLGDGGPATQASLDNPQGIFVDTAGNLYIADTGNHRIRKVNSHGIIATIAGSDGNGNFSGDGGPATQASFHSPSGVYVDAIGTVYIADTKNNAIRTVNPAGIVRTIMRSATPVFSVTGDDHGNVYFSNEFDHGCMIYKMVPDLGGPNELQPISRVVSAGRGFSFPAGVAVANGVLYFTDRSQIDGAAGMNELFQDQERLSWKWGPVVGNGDYNFSGDGGPATQASLDNPQGIFVDTAGNLYIADTGNHRIRKVNSHGIIATIAGSDGNGNFSGDGGPATQASLDNPRGIFVDTVGNVYIADTGNNRVRVVSGLGVSQGGQGAGISNSDAHIHEGKATIVSLLPQVFALGQNHPNPFNPSTQIAYDVPQAARVTLAIYNLLGQEVNRLVDEEKNPGRYGVTWDGRNAQGVGVASGVYLYRMTTSAGFSHAYWMTLLR